MRCPCAFRHRPGRSRSVLCLLLALLLCLAACGCSGKKGAGLRAGRGPDTYSVRGKTYHVMREARGYAETGMASWYGPGFHGRKTASGERFDQKALTAAHKTLPFGTRVRVENLANGREVVVRINDRGPFSAKRIIDLSRAAAQKLGMIASGTARVRVTALDGAEQRQAPPAGATPAGIASSRTISAPMQQAQRAADPLTGLFYIQAGSFSGRPQAEAMALDMRMRGYGCRVARGAGNAHLVQLGPYFSRAEAEKERKKLRSAFIVAE